jgi:hypothetical protein
VSLRAHLGLVPVNPARLLVALVAIVLLFVASIGALFLWPFPIPSPRASYFAWLAGLCVAALLLTRVERLAALVLSLAAIDIGLGLGSQALEGWGVQSILPPAYYPDTGFQWHPLLQATPRPSLAGGYAGLKITHSSVGTRGRDYTPAELADRTVIAVFGGSTTYDLGVTDGATWPEQLEKKLGPAFAVINHGVPGYTTVESLVQTAFYQDSFGRDGRIAQSTM